MPSFPNALADTPSPLNLRSSGPTLYKPRYHITPYALVGRPHLGAGQARPYTHVLRIELSYPGLVR